MKKFYKVTVILHLFIFLYSWQTMGKKGNKSTLFDVTKGTRWLASNILPSVALQGVSLWPAVSKEKQRDWWTVAAQLTFVSSEVLPRLAM